MKQFKRLITISLITLVAGLSFIYYKFTYWAPIEVKIEKRTQEIYALENEIMSALKRYCGLDHDFHCDHVPELIHEAVQDHDEDDTSKIDTFLILVANSNHKAQEIHFHNEINKVASHFRQNTGSINKCANFLEELSNSNYNVSFLVSDKVNFNEMKKEGFDIVGMCIENYYKCYAESEEGKNKKKISLDIMKQCFNQSKQSRDKCINLWSSQLVLTFPYVFTMSQFYVSFLEDCKYAGCNLNKFIDFHKIYPEGYEPLAKNRVAKVNF